MVELLPVNMTRLPPSPKPELSLLVQVPSTLIVSAGEVEVSRSREDVLLLFRSMATS